MATFDISRVAFNPVKHYSSVRMQQGRVLTDDDWNENERIEEEILRRTQVDVIGRAGTPDDGFKISGLRVDPLTNAIDFDIHKGTMYSGGIRFEMEAPETYALQRDWLQKQAHDAPKPADFPQGVTELYDLVYLEGWQQPVCAVEDRSLYEVALGGPDTTVRLRNMRRVKLFRNTGSDECSLSWKKMRTTWKSDHFGSINKDNELIPNANLKVSFTDTGATDDLCTPSRQGGYLGAENQAIRVQVTRFDNVNNTWLFTWGFDNAAPLYRVSITPDGLTITLKTEPKDQYHWPLSGQVVEILPWSAVLPNNEKIAEQTGFLSRVNASYNPDDKTFTLTTAVPAGFGEEWLKRTDANIITEEVFFYMRIWNRGTDIQSDAEIKFTPGNPVKLGNTGLEVTFTGTEFIAPDKTTGNYWVIAARPADPKKLSPWELSTSGISPHGVRFFYAPLAIVQWTLIQGQMVEGMVIHDCRKRFRPLTEQECCCTFTVGDGVTSIGDYQSIQEAINNLPPEGGKICVLAGIHRGNVKIVNRKQIQVIGCGEQSIVRSRSEKDTTVFLIRHSQKIKIENLTIVSFEGIGILVNDVVDNAPASSSITIRENRILACIHAVRVNLKEDDSGMNNIKITFNLIGMYDSEKGDVAIFSLADDVLIERNRIVIVQVPPREPNDPEPEPPRGEPLDPCPDKRKLYIYNKKFRYIVFDAFAYITAFIPGSIVRIYKAPGGIQIGCGSEKVWILQNEIFGGRGNGITLGHHDLKYEKSEKIFSPTLYDITIQENLIYEMGLCGIGTVLLMMVEKKPVIIHTENLLIVENTIRFCVHVVEKEHKVILDTNIPAAPIALSFCEDCIIRENWIEENGRYQEQAVSGVFIFFGEKIDISGNRIIDNGPDVQEAQRLRVNVKGGIVIWFAMSLPRPKYSKANYLNNNNATNINRLEAVNLLTAADSVPAVKIHDNIVTQPIGHALFTIAMGPVSVVSNQFTSQGINKPDIFSLIAGSVFIFNLGISKDFFNILFQPMANWTSVSPSVILAAAEANGNAPNSFFTMFQNLPSGKTMFSANQVVLDMRSFEQDLCLSSQLIFSLDDIAFVNNQSECAGFVGGAGKLLTYDIAFFNTVLLSISTRCNDNRFTDGFTLTFFSLLSRALMSTAVSNQSTHCLLVPYLAFRRKSLNIELNNALCTQPKLEDNLSNTHGNLMATPHYNVSN